MGVIAATTFIKNIRVNLDENLNADTDLILPGSGTRWINSEILEYLNKAKDRIWDIIRLDREDYFVTIGATVTLNSTTKTYSLASGFRQLTGMRITTSGFETLQFRAVDPSSTEWKSRDALPQNSNTGSYELIYNIVSTGTLRLADYPPTTLTLSYDYVGYLSDFTLSASSTVDVNDELREYLEAYATELAFMKFPSDPRLKTWQEKKKELLPIVMKSVAKRQIRESERVEQYDPY